MPNLAFQITMNAVCLSDRFQTSERKPFLLQRPTASLYALKP